MGEFSGHSQRKIRRNDAQLIDEAYQASSGVYYSNHTLAIAGTRGPRDVLSDALLAVGLTDTLPGSRELVVEKALKEHNVQRLIGHSLGGYVAADHANEVPAVVAYNPGVVSTFPPGENISIVRNVGDVISAPLMGDHRTENEMHDGWWNPIDSHRMPDPWPHHRVKRLSPFDSRAPRAK